MKFYCDGSGWNGRESKFCIVKEDGNVEVIKRSDKKTSNEMEYMAVIKALEQSKEGDILYTDSRLVVGQLMENWKINAVHLFPLIIRAKQLIKGRKLEWLPREENKAGHILENGKISEKN